MAKKKNNYSPEVQSKIQQMRFQIATELNYLQPPYDPNWWDTLTNPQKSEIQGIVTKLLVAKAQMDMRDGKFTL